MHTEKQDPLEFEENKGTIGYGLDKLRKVRNTATKAFVGKNTITGSKSVDFEVFYKPK